jgi:hypothetical protein
MKSHFPRTDLRLSNFNEHFKSVCSNNVGNYDINIEQNDRSVFEELDVPISCDEVGNVLKNLKAGKLPGIDNLLYEYFYKFFDVLLHYCHVYSMSFLILVHFQHVGLKESFSHHLRKGMLTTPITIEVLPW